MLHISINRKVSNVTLTVSSSFRTVDILHSASIGNGHQPTLPNDCTVTKAAADSNPYNLPDSLHMAILTQLLCDKIHVAFSNLDDPYSNSVIKVLESDLQDLEVRLATFDTCEWHIVLVQAGASTNQLEYTKSGQLFISLQPNSSSRRTCSSATKIRQPVGALSWKP